MKILFIYCLLFGIVGLFIGINVLIGYTLDFSLMLTWIHIPLFLLCSIIGMGIKYTRRSSRGSERLSYNLPIFIVCFFTIFAWTMTHEKFDDYWRNNGMSHNYTNRLNSNNKPLAIFDQRNIFSENNQLVLSLNLDRDQVLNAYVDENKNTAISLERPKIEPRIISMEQLKGAQYLEISKSLFSIIYNHISSLYFSRLSIYYKLFFYICIALLSASFVLLLGLATKIMSYIHMFAIWYVYIYVVIILGLANLWIMLVAMLLTFTIIGIMLASMTKSIIQTEMHNISGMELGIYQ